MPVITKLALFPTCLVDLYRPSVGFAVVALLEKAGFAVEVPENLTCCGQPAYNSGDKKNAQKIALQTLATLEDFEYIIIPSGSCASMMIKHYPTLFEDGSQAHQRAVACAEKCYEFTQFLHHKTDIDLSDIALNETLTYHDSCSGYRDLKIYQEPRALLSSVQGVKLKEMEDSFVCCGFGGTFCVKYPEISNAMVKDKCHNITQSEAGLVSGGDLGCLMNIAGKLQREKGDEAVKLRHIAEILAGDDITPPIGCTSSSTAQKTKHDPKKEA